MAAIDHTDIVFKNGEWIREPYHYDENDNYVNDLPFEYGRDGNIHTINGEYIYNNVKWYRHEYDAIYERKGVDSIRNFKCLNFYMIKSRLAWLFRRMERVCYRKEVGVWESGHRSLYIYYEPLNQSYVSFYYDGTDSWVVIGGYGHWNNVYTHFAYRGYGDEFEKQMTIEAYHWACDKVIKDMADYIAMVECISEWEEQDRILEKMKEHFAKYDTEYLKEY